MSELSELLTFLNENGGLDGNTLLILVVIGFLLFSKHGFAKRSDLEGIREHMREQSDKRDEQVESIRNSVNEIQHSVAAQGKELHERIDRVESVQREDRNTLTTVVGDLKVVQDRSYSGRCSSHDAPSSRRDSHRD